MYGNLHMRDICLPKPQKLGAYRFGVSVPPSARHRFFPGCIFVTNSHRHLRTGSYERSWCGTVQIWPPEMAKFGQNVQKQRFFENNLSGQSDHQKVMCKFPDFSLISLFSLIGGHPVSVYSVLFHNFDIDHINLKHRCCARVVRATYRRTRSKRSF